ncbi:hypothetical protein [uncultured Chitinophaga sp.]|jgi:hypothetical protein|uniref:hypothetical protein n=1 Tax=uncultured Chitinophaga sp. TaxID=339340 RepID=UPI00263521EA|nr:hypothetical protein [uncultured Chitinophaga sp.]
MNFDDLQSAWHSDKGNDIVVPDSVAKLRSAVTPVQHIRRNMRKEFVVMLVIIIAFPFFPLTVAKGLALVPFYAMYAAMVILTVFYFIKFYLFYKRLDTVTLNSKDSLYEVYYDIKLNIEMYRSFNYAIIPLLLLYQVMVMISLPSRGAAFANRNVYFIIIFSVTFLVFMGIMLVFVEWWISYFYGSYLKQVKKVLDELKEE